MWRCHPQLTRKDKVIKKGLAHNLAQPFFYDYKPIFYSLFSAEITALIGAMVIEVSIPAP